MKTIRRVVAFSLCIMLALSLTIPVFAIGLKARTTVRIRSSMDTSSTQNIYGQIYINELFWISYVRRDDNGIPWYYGVPDESTKYYEYYGALYGWAASEDENGNLLFT